jgi:transposase
MITKINKIINGEKCIKCGEKTLYRLSDDRLKCKHCASKYSTNKIKNDLVILHYFCLEIPANKAAADLGFSYKKVSNKYMAYRREIVKFLDQEFNKLSGEIECDESYFGGRRKGNRGRGAAGKTRVFGMLERNGQIFTTIVDDVSAESIMNEIKEHARKGSVFYTDKFRSYKSLKFFGKHLTIDHTTRFKRGKNHINGLEGFWSYAKERFLKYHGVNKEHFYYYLKEMQFRYNYRKENIYQFLMKMHFGPEIT